MTMLEHALGYVSTAYAGRRLLSVFLVYVACGWVGIEYAGLGNGSLTLIWLPSGISLAALLLYGRQIWPAIWAGSFVANTPYLIESAAAPSLWLALVAGGLAATINTRFQALMAYSLYQKYITQSGFYATQNIVRFLYAVILLPTVFNITLLVLLYGSIGYWSIGEMTPFRDLVKVWFSSALSDVHGYFVIVPLVMCWQNLKLETLMRREAIIAALGLAALLVTSIHFMDAAVYLLIPLGVFAAIKLGLRGASLFLFVTSITLTLATAQMQGPFARAEIGYSYITLLIFVFSFGLPILVLAAETHSVRRAYRDMEGMVRERTRRLNEANRQLEIASRTDMVTGIHNRRYLDERLQEVWQQGVQTRQPVSLVLIDIDYFKSYNDHYGHLAGDAVLAEVAAALSQVIRSNGDFIARYGGEEFAIILPATTDASVIAERCRTSVEEAAIVHAHSPIADIITVSAGYACMVPATNTQPDELIARADAALYQAKNRGRNRSTPSADNSET